MILTGHPLDPEEHELLRRHRAHLFLKPDGYRHAAAAPRSADRPLSSACEKGPIP